MTVHDKKPTQKNASHDSFMWLLKRWQKNSKPQASCHRAFQIVVATYAIQHLTINWNMCPNFIYLWQLCDSYFPSLWKCSLPWSATQGFQGRRRAQLLGQRRGEVLPEGWRGIPGAVRLPLHVNVNWCKNLDVSAHSANLITFSPLGPPAPWPHHFLK